METDGSETTALLMHRGVGLLGLNLLDLSSPRNEYGFIMTRANVGRTNTKVFSRNRRR